MKTRRWAITLASCLVIVALLSTFKVFQIRAAIAFGESFPEPSATVDALVTSRQTVEKTIFTIGEILSPQFVELRAELEGTIKSVNFTAGSIVKKGDVLIQLDISEEQARLNAAKARAKLARLDSIRVKKLLKERSVSQERVDQAEAEYAIATSEVEAIQSIINKKTIKAPFDGKSGLHLFEPGQYLQRNSIITTLLGLKPYYWLDFTLPLTTDLPELGDKVVISSEGTLAGLYAEIEAKESIASGSTRSLRFRAKLTTTEIIPPNSLVKIKVILGEEDIVTIPLMAIQNDSLGTFVYRLEEDEKQGQYRAKRQQVVIGKEINEMVTIIEGLPVDVLIAVNGAFKLRTDLLVHIADSNSSTSIPPQVKE